MAHDATQKKYPHIVHFNVLRDWFERNSLHQKRYSEGREKIVSVWSAGKSSKQVERSCSPSFLVYCISRDLCPPKREHKIILGDRKSRN